MTVIGCQGSRSRGGLSLGLVLDRQVNIDGIDIRQA
jgi:hypothetical protein